MNLKNQLKLYLKEEEVTAAKLAKRAGIPRSTLADWLSGSTPRDVHKLKKLATALETDVDWLVWGNGIRRVDSPVEEGMKLGQYEIILRPIKNRDFQ